MPVTRRRFVGTGAAATAAVVFAPQSLALAQPRAQAVKLLRGGFAEGVASGDPTPTGIVLWTRLTGAEGNGRVELEVSTDKAFRKTVSRTQITTSAKVNHAVKARVSRLKPHEQYYYRFSSATKHSDVGRFRTAPPADSTAPITFAYFSCADYTHGYYNAYQHMAEQDLDFVVCLGDYIYDETYHSVADKTGVRDDKIGRSFPDYKDAIRSAVTLADYRAKYSLYRSDKHLRTLHARVPMVTLWDDHEVMNNYTGAEADGGLPKGYGYTTARKLAGYKAWGESMPTFGKGANGNRIYRKLSFGKNIDLVVMDQRQYRDNQPCNDEVAVACADLDQPRAFLGATQLNWVKDQLAASRANWKVLANELMVMPTKATAGTYLNFDSWQGYPREREELLSFIDQKAIKDVVFVTGDIHTFIAGEVQLGLDGKGKGVATEVVGGSITSAGLGESNLDVGGGTVIQGNDQNPSTPPALIEALRGLNPWVDVADFDHHGYGLVKADEATFDTSFVRLETVKRKTTKTLSDKGFHWKLPRGEVGTKGHEA